MNNTRLYTILADDLTGACDTGVAFARHGWAARVAFSPHADFGGAAVRVLTTESRSLTEDAAGQAVQGAARALCLGSHSLIYKKIDSTLRGYPGAELAALMRASGIKRALVAPAFPEQDRQVRGGQVWVRGVPLSETEFACAVPQADLLRLFAPAGAGCGGCHAVSLDALRIGIEPLVGMLMQPGIHVADAENNADLVLLIQAARRAGIRLLCGSAGLARALVRSLPSGSDHFSLEGRQKPALVIAGSRSPVTLRQVTRAGEAGLRILLPELGDLRIATPAPAKENFLSTRHAETIVQQATIALSAGENVVIGAGKMVMLPGAEGQVAAVLAAWTAAVLTAVPIGGLVLTGGETAAAVFRALGCAAFDLGGEVQPGVVWGSLGDGPYARLPVITKAGGFGDDDTLLRAVNVLNSSTATN